MIWKTIICIKKHIENYLYFIPFHRIHLTVSIHRLNWNWNCKHICILKFAKRCRSETRSEIAVTLASDEWVKPPDKFYGGWPLVDDSDDSFAYIISTTFNMHVRIRKYYILKINERVHVCVYVRGGQFFQMVGRIAILLGQSHI